MSEDTDDTAASWLVLENQLWVTCLVGGLLGFAVGSAALILLPAFIAIGMAAKVETLGITQTGVAVVVGLIFTSVIASRFRQYAAAMFLGLASVVGNIGSIIHLEIEDAHQFTREIRPLMFFGMGILAFIGIGTLNAIAWSCPTANPAGGPTHAVCLWFDSGWYRSLLLFVIRLLGAGFGVGGTLFTGVVLLELRFGWRESSLQARYRESSLYEWLHPMADFRRTLESDTGDESSDESVGAESDKETPD